MALVGPSGSGKTTIAGLIPRFYDPEFGHVRLDGIDLRDLTLESLRANVALVSQDIVLFDDTVAANIAYGATAAAPRDAITNAARAAHALEFIEAMPHGLDTIIGERGVKLSGGQRQRLAIAPCGAEGRTGTDPRRGDLLARQRGPSGTFRMRWKICERGRATLVIAHRLSTIEGADRIIVMDRGRVTDTGTHAELLGRSGLYAGLYRLQFVRRERIAQPANQA